VTDNPLAIIEHPAGTELALPDHLVEAARDFQREALAERTRQTYADAWRLFLDWCNTMGRRSLPASPQSVAGWLTELATGGKWQEATIGRHGAPVPRQRGLYAQSQRRGVLDGAS
jgi:hypothetical protein